MIEFIAPIAVGALGLIPRFTKKNERAQIEQVFKNTNFHVKQDGNVKYPHFMKKRDNELMRTYEYKLPLGLVIKDDLAEKLSKALAKTVEVEGENVLTIWVFKKKLPKKLHYKDIPSKDGWVVPIGMSYKGIVWHDFDKIPMTTIAGTTRFGKTVMMKNIMTYLTEHHEEDVEFYIIDMKSGLEFHRYSKLKQVKGIASTIPEASKMLDEITKEINETIEDFKRMNVTNVVNSKHTKRTFLIVDEGARLSPSKQNDPELKKILRNCQSKMSEIAAIGGGVSYGMVYGTQYPTTESLPREIKMNADAKISFRLPAGYASEVAIDERGAEKLEGQGRAIYKTHEKVMVQAPLIEDEEMWERLRRYESDKAHAEVREGGTNSNHLRQIGRSNKIPPASNE